MLRFALAIVFAFTTLAHEPVMAFAKAGAAHPHHRDIAQPAEMDHMAVGHDHHAIPEQAPICAAVGCFNVVVPIAVTAPNCSTALLERLRPPPARMMIPDPPDPTVPPPRLQG